MHHRPPIATLPCPESTSSTPFELVGGLAGIGQLVDLLLDRLLYDPLVAPALIGVDMARLRSAQEEFFTEALTGPPEHDSATPLLIRASDRALVQVIVHVRGALFSLGLADAAVDQVMLAVIDHTLARKGTSQQSGGPTGPGRLSPARASR